MKKSILLVTFILTVFASAYALETWEIEPGVGVGPIKFGMSLKTAQKILKDEGQFSNNQFFYVYKFEKYHLDLFIEESTKTVIGAGVSESIYNNIEYKMKNGLRVGKTKNFALSLLGNNFTAKTIDEDIGVMIYDKKIFIFYFFKTGEIVKIMTK